MLIPFLRKKLSGARGSGRRRLQIHEYLIAEAIGLCDSETHLAGLAGFLEVAPFSGVSMNRTVLVGNAKAIPTKRFFAHQADEEWLMAA